MVFGQELSPHQDEFVCLGMGFFWLGGLILFMS